MDDGGRQGAVYTRHGLTAVLSQYVLSRWLNLLVDRKIYKIIIFI